MEERFNVAGLGIGTCYRLFGSPRAEFPRRWLYVREADTAAGHAGGRTSAVRVFVVQYFRNVASGIEHDASPPLALRQSVPQAA